MYPLVCFDKRARAAALGMSLGLVTLAAPATAAVTINGGFETPDLGTTASFSFRDEDDVDGWTTTDSAIEIWANGFNGVTSYEGTQHAEINARNFGTLSQTVSGITVGADITLQFAHRARQGTDEMRVDLVDLGASLLDDSDDTVLHTMVYSAGTSAWVFTSLSGISALGNDIRLSFTAVSTGSNSISVGNFLDAVHLEGSLAPVPLPATGLLLLGGLGAIGYARRARRKS